MGGGGGLHRPDAVRIHLQSVYLTLAAGTAAAAGGGLLHLRTGMGGGLLGFLGVLGLIFYLWATPKQSLSKRQGIFLGIAGLMGMNMGPLLAATIALDPKSPLMALGASSMVLGAFSVSALLAKRRSLLFIGAILGAAVSMLSFLSLMNLF